MYLKKPTKRTRRTMVTLFMCLLCSFTFAQTRSVSGIIKDTSGEAMIGVSVLAKGTSNGTITDIDGKFTLSSITNNSTIVISYVGYIKQEITIGNQTLINVTLKEESQALEEVVVVGYGVQKKSDLTGSVGSVSAERIASVGTSSVMGALQGASPGVDIITTSARPGGGFSIQIRGQNSLNGGNPLYVVDGIIVDDIDFLNPSNIERVDVLKDASSTAIYGSRGSNGVVIVQTKGASAAKTKLSVTYDGYYGIRELTRIPEFMDGREWMDFRTSRYYAWNATTGAYELSTSNKTAVTQSSKLINTALHTQQYTDWLDLGTDTGSQQNHYVNISGATKEMSYNIGVGYQNEKGNFMMEEMNRYLLKGSIRHKANEYFSSGVDFTLSQNTINTGSQNGYREILRMLPYFKAYDENGEYIKQPGTAAAIEGSGNFTSTPNPLLEIESGSNETTRFDILGSVFAEFIPTKGLSLKTTFFPRLNQRRAAYYRGRTPDRANDQARTEHRTKLDWTWDNVINYNKIFAQKHALNVTLINSVYKSQTESLRVGAQDFPYNSQWYNIFNGTLVPGDNNSSYSQTTMISYAARVNYDYAGKYLVTGTVRYDGSSKLADKWAAFPSAAVAWRISEEDFMKGIDWLSNLKTRLSYGFSGNNNGIDTYGTQATPDTGSIVRYDFSGTDVTGFGTGTPVNVALTWEKTREWNLGFDWGFFGGRINGSIDLYDKLSDGLLMNRILTIESGVASMRDNIGSVNNRGIEIGLNTTNVKTKDLEWKTSFTFAHNKNAIRSLYGKKEDVIGESHFIGQPINVTYDYKVNGVYSQAEWAAMTPDQRTKMGAVSPGYAKAIDTNGDEKMSSDDRTILGKNNPDWTGSVTSTLRYHDFDFSFNVYARQGLLISDNFFAEFNGAASNDRGRPKIKFDYYVPGDVPRIDWSNFNIDADGQAWVTWGTSTENANAKYPINGMTGSFYGNNGRYQDASFVKVRNITFGYTLSQNLIKKTGLSHVRVYLNILNPFTFTNYVGWDPEYATTGLTDGNGPSSIVYQIGANLKF